MGSRPVERGSIGFVVRHNLRRIRDEQRFSLRQLSERVEHYGRSMLPSAIGKMETGERRIDVDDLVTLAAALGVPMPELFRVSDRAGSPDVRLGIGDFSMPADEYDVLVGLRPPQVHGGTPEVVEEQALPIGRVKRRQVGTALEGPLAARVMDAERRLAEAEAAHAAARAALRDMRESGASDEEAEPFAAALMDAWIAQAEAIASRDRVLRLASGGTGA